jgi:hypothetical protein
LSVETNSKNLPQDTKVFIKFSPSGTVEAVDALQTLFRAPRLFISHNISIILDITGVTICSYEIEVINLFTQLLLFKKEKK